MEGHDMSKARVRSLSILSLFSFLLILSTARAEAQEWSTEQQGVWAAVQELWQYSGALDFDPWFERVMSIEEFEDAELDAGLVADMQRQAGDSVHRMVRFSTPTFKEYESTELQSCGKNSFPAFSITAGGCALMCDHCEAKILEPMIPAVKPEILTSSAALATNGAPRSIRPERAAAAIRFAPRSFFCLQVIRVLQFRSVIWPALPGPGHAGSHCVRLGWLRIASRCIGQ